MANFGNIIFVIISNAFIVEKANKCLDFTLTIFILHVISVWIYNQKFPWSLEWWLTNAAIIFVTTILAEWTCMRIEQQEIKLSFDSNGINKIVEQGKQVIKEVQTKLENKKVPKKKSDYQVGGNTSHQSDLKNK